MGFLELTGNVFDKWFCNSVHIIYIVSRMTSFDFNIDWATFDPLMASSWELVSIGTGDDLMLNNNFLIIYICCYQISISTVYVSNHQYGIKIFCEDVFLGLSNGKGTLAHVRVWYYCEAIRHYLTQHKPISMMEYGVSWPQWAEGVDAITMAIWGCHHKGDFGTQ